MAEITIKVRVRIAWWVRWYIRACVLFAVMHGLRPDVDKIARFVVVHGVKLEFVNG
ncbi:hypothetical protein [Polaromonas jejuensis]|uniref:Transposase n=1 Tax=Polaromonas jejuensis TaxID=457502 RepID=A0ABW0QMU4_9BURK|nr:hypothetical protein [Polaromonas jejuensis]